MSLTVALIGLPIVGAIHAFASNMGYHYQPVRIAAWNAVRVGFLLSLISLTIGALQ